MDKKVCILYTGGTIGMVPTDRGYAPKKGYFQSLLDEIVQLRYEDMPQWDLVEFDPLLDSSDVAVDEWNSIGQAISSRYDDYDGFVVLAQYLSGHEKLFRRKGSLYFVSHKRHG